MPDLGKKYTCYSCHTKFYDLGKAIPICPKCSADQRDAEDAPPVTASRSRASRAAPAPVVVEEPAEEDFAGDAETPAVAEGEEDEELIVEPEREEEEADDDEEEY